MAAACCTLQEHLHLKYIPAVNHTGLLQHLHCLPDTKFVNPCQAADAAFWCLQIVGWVVATAGFVLALVMHKIAHWREELVSKCSASFWSCSLPVDGQQRGASSVSQNMALKHTCFKSMRQSLQPSSGCVVC